MAFAMIHENYNVSDLNRSIAFYGEALGLQELRRKTASDGSFTIAFLGDGISGFELELSYDRFAREYRLRLIGQLSHQVTLGKDAGGNISRIDNALAALPERLIQVEQELATLHQQLITAQVEVEKPFAQAAELQEKAARLSELDVLLNLNEHDQTLLDEEPEEDVEDRGRISRQRISATER